MKLSDLLASEPMPQKIKDFIYGLAQTFDIEHDLFNSLNHALSRIEHKISHLQSKADSFDSVKNSIRSLISPDE